MLVFACSIIILSLRTHFLKLGISYLVIVCYPFTLITSPGDLFSLLSLSLCHTIGQSSSVVLLQKLPCHKPSTCYVDSYPVSTLDSHLCLLVSLSFIGSLVAEIDRCLPFTLCTISTIGSQCDMWQHEHYHRRFTNCRDWWQAKIGSISAGASARPSPSWDAQTLIVQPLTC